MAWLCAVLVLVITSLSAYLRLSKLGLGCTPWPQCYGQALRDAQRGVAVKPDDATATAVARAAHRVAAVLALLLVLVMVMTALGSRPLLWREGGYALALLGLALFLAVLGRWTANARVPAVTLGNLLAGFAMFALSCRLAQTAWPAHGAARPRSLLNAWAALGLLLLLLQVALGGLVSAGHAGLSCPSLGAGCDGAVWSWQALDPLREPQLDAVQPGHVAGAAMQLAHRAVAVLCALVLLPLGVLAWRAGRRAGKVLLVLLIGQAALGAMLVLGGLPLAAALLHNMLAAALLAALLALAGNAPRLR
ncbi:MAG: COX15/CtaA family protein [Burkholderiales bacterium]|nr:COX15/CtaA family protein [Burkholderiales bacterium]